MMRWGTMFFKRATESPPSHTTTIPSDTVSSKCLLRPSLAWPPTFCEASFWVQVFLRLFHWDLFYFWLDIDGTSFRGASIIQFLDMQGKGRSRSRDSATTCPLSTDYSIPLVWMMY